MMDSETLLQLRQCSVSLNKRIVDAELPVRLATSPLGRLTLALAHQVQRLHETQPAFKPVVEIRK